ncbi:MAG: TIGR02710 family CRISPR-associated CARF protein [Nitrospira sp.]|nr:TIGR02710 family CRISPR-associated CARF protein [Nitrospira sp.]
MSGEYRTKALLIAVSEAPIPVQACINRLAPEFLCFVVSESRKGSIEADIQPAITTMPQRWDWIFVEESESFTAVHQALTKSLPEMLKTWGLQPGELVVDFSRATPAIAAAMALAGRPWMSQVVGLTAPGNGTGKPALSVARQRGVEGSDVIEVGDRAFAWQEGNPWNEEAVPARQEAALLFNQGGFSSAAKRFRRIESLVGGSLKPLYHGLADLADGYAAWESFKYRDAWDKLKTAHKALELASVWGGPAGMSSLLSGVKHNLKFLESIVIDPDDVKLPVAHDLLAHAKRRAGEQQIDSALQLLLRALEAYAQYHLWKQYRIKSWDVQVDQLPQDLQEACRTCYSSDVDGKFHLPLHAQFRALSGLGHPMGQTFVNEWTKLKTLWDAAHQSVLGHGFHTTKADRFHQFYTAAIKLTNVTEPNLPVFPKMTL